MREIRDLSVRYPSCKIIILTTVAAAPFKASHTKVDAADGPASSPVVLALIGGVAGLRQPLNARIGRLARPNLFAPGSA